MTTEVGVMSCLLCGKDLSGVTEVEQEQHVNRCLDIKDNQMSVFNNVFSFSQSNEKGLRNPKFYCVLCDIDLSKRGLFPRCQHLKRCAKENKIATKDLIGLVTGFIDESKELSDTEGCENDGIDIVDVDEDAANFNIMDSSNNDQGKNAWSIMMASAKEMSKSKGFVQSSSKEKKTKEKKVAPEEKENVSAPAAKKPRSHYQYGFSRNNSSKKASAATSNGHVPDSNGNYIPAYKKIQVGNMTCPIIVDGFQYAAANITDTYFLTHFHSDHYMGLDNSFSYGNIYCSPTTAALVKLKLKVNSAFIIPLQLEKKYNISVGGVNVEVTLMEANHCPGATCILFEFATNNSNNNNSSGSSNNNKKILHTGDFRWCSRSLLRKSPCFRSLANTGKTSNIRNLTVYLDTTYCDPTYTFPDQEVIISNTMEYIKQEMKIPGTLFLFGAYTIGKEKLFMAAADEIKSKVYVDKSRWRTMLCYDWTIEEQAKLTVDPKNSKIWVVNMNQINFNQIENIQRKQHNSTTSTGISRIVAFQPTGWTHSSNGGSGGNGSYYGQQRKSTNANSDSNSSSNNDDASLDFLNPTTTSVNKNNHSSSSNNSNSNNSSNSGIHKREKNRNIIYSVPYSEHSSFTELVDFIQTFRPQRVIPTVNTSQDKVKTQIDLLKQYSHVYDNHNNDNTSANYTNNARGHVVQQNSSNNVLRPITNTVSIISSNINHVKQNNTKNSSAFNNPQVIDDDFNSEFC